MRYFFIAMGLSVLCLTGCGNDNTNTNVAANHPNIGTVQPSPLETGVQFSSSNVVPVSTTVLNTVFAPGGVFELGLTPQTVFTALDMRHPTALAESLLGSFGTLAVAGSTNGNGFTSTVANGSTVSVVFNNFTTANGTLSGTVLYNGAPNQAGFTSNATFQALNVFPANGARAYRLDGPAAYNVTATSATSVVKVLGANYVVTDAANGGTARFQNFLSASNISVTQNVPSGTVRSGGRVSFREFQNLNGFVDIATQVPFAFTNTVASSGSSTYTGIGASRLTLVGPNQMEIAFANTGQTPLTFTQVTVVNLFNLLGLTEP